MIGNFRRVPNRVVLALRDDPSKITSVLYPDSTTETAIDDDVQLDIDKAWHGLHFLLAGEAWGGSPPLDFILGGTPFGDIDVGYGPAHGYTSDEVRSIAAALALVNDDTLRARFDPAKMIELAIYPEIWDRDPKQDDTLGYLLQHFASLKEFVTDTAQYEAAMIVFLN